ncbi:hypothetical protein V5735_23630 (plasmid) [Haladaptatus sp. SPP-AMP-3]
MEKRTTSTVLETGFTSTAALDATLDYGADEGAEQTLDRLTEYLTNGGWL